MPLSMPLSEPLSMPLSMPLSGAPFFSYQSGALCVDGLPLRDLARQYGTPLFVYSQAAMLAALAAYSHWHLPTAAKSSSICKSHYKKSG